jgi:predicted nucleic acid-binding protein
LSLLESLPFEVDGISPGRMFAEIFALARKHQLSTYDASYLDLALRRQLPLATQDKALIRAAADCGVALFQP